MALLLVACSGGSGSSSAAIPNVAASAAHAGTGSPSNHRILAPDAAPAVVAADSPVPSPTVPVPVTMTYAFGAATPAAKSLSERRTTQSSAYTGYTSTAAPVSISLNVTPLGGATSNYTGSCTAAANGLSGTCTVTFTAAPGPTTFSGTVIESAQTIASFSQIEIV